jgi:RHS repeat-associated protein
METDLSGTTPDEYVFFNDQRIARRTASGTLYYFFSDHLGSSRIVTDSAGTVVEDSDFYPFGGERVVVDTLSNNYKFTGHERDGESGLDYFIARHYAFSLGRFLQPDAPFADQRPSDPQTWNLYSYVSNKPLAHVDPTGWGKLSVFLRVITRIVIKDGKETVFKKVVNQKLSRDEARRVFRKEGQDVFGSKKGAKNVAGRGAVEDAAPTRGGGDRLPHFHDKGRSGPHAFFRDGSGTGIVIPGNALGSQIFGDNLLGDIANFFNPLADIQDIADFTDILTSPDSDSDTEEANSEKSSDSKTEDKDNKYSILPTPDLERLYQMFPGFPRPPEERRRGHHHKRP